MHTHTHTPLYRLEVFKGTEHGFAVRGGVSIPAVAEARARALKAAATFFVTHLLG